MENGWKLVLVQKNRRKFPKDKVDYSPQLPKSPQIPTKLENPSPTKEPELLKTIEKLKGELVEKDLIIAEKDKQLTEFKERLNEITKENNYLIQNYTNLKNTAENQRKRKVNNNQILTEPSQEKGVGKILLNSEENLSNTLSKIKETQNNPLATKEKPQTELVSEIQVWKKLKREFLGCDLTFKEMREFLEKR